MLPACRLTLELQGPLGTPLRSGTLFGHLAWAMIERDGDARNLEALIDGLNEAPFLLSDGLPEGYLPKPLLPPESLPATADRADALAALDALERRRKHAWITREAFFTHRKGLSEAAIEACADPWGVPARTPHVSLHRLEQRPHEPGGLYFTDAWWPEGPTRRLDLYVCTTMPRDELIDLLERVGARGYGRDASTGHGRFAVVGEAEETELFAPVEAPDRRLMSLSHGCLSDNMKEARWRLAPHFGRIGAMMQQAGNRPWKRPILLLAPGCTWRPADEAVAGRWLAGNLHQDNDRIGHHAFHLSVAYAEAAEETGP